MKEKINFERTIFLKLSAGAESFVKIPHYSRLPSDKFLIQIDPTKLESGKVHYAEITGNNPWKTKLGAIFRIPITIIIPEEVNEKMGYFYKKIFILKPGLHQRIFLIPKSFCLLLTYKLNVIKKNTFMFTLEGISEYFKYLDSISYQINTKSKINIYTFYKPRYTHLKPGIYEICVQIRNSKIQMLEKLKTATLLVDESILPIEANLYHNADLALKERGKKIEPKIYQPRQKANVYVACIPVKKLPASYPTGTYLEGTFSLFSNFEKFMDESFANFKVRYDFPTSKKLNYL